MGAVPRTVFGGPHVRGESQRLEWAPGPRRPSGGEREGDAAPGTLRGCQRFHPAPMRRERRPREDRLQTMSRLSIVVVVVQGGLEPRDGGPDGTTGSGPAERGIRAVDGHRGQRRVGRGDRRGDRRVGACEDVELGRDEVVNELHSNITARRYIQEVVQTRLVVARTPDRESGLRPRRKMVLPVARRPCSDGGTGPITRERRGDAIAREDLV